MKLCGIIAEYNPLHKGHVYQLNQAKAITGADAIVLIMSGNFVQRGQVAFLNKHQRTQVALENGADLVLELPTYFATASAEYFAHHAIYLLDRLNIVTHLNFGSESGDLPALITLAELLHNEPKAYQTFLAQELMLGHAYPKARKQALAHYLHHHTSLPATALAPLETPNNILGIEYLKALMRLNSSITPTTTKRIGATYHDTNSQIPLPSATAIRKHLFNGLDIQLLKDALPSTSYSQLEHSYNERTGPLFANSFYTQLKYKLLVTPTDTLKLYQDVTEGLENRIKRVASTTYTYHDLIDSIVSKRYTRTKITRALTHIYLGHTKKNFKQFSNELLPYGHVLGFTAKGQKILHLIKQQENPLPIIVNRKDGYKKLDPLQKKSFEADLNSSLIYNHLIHTTYGTITKNDYQLPVLRI